jgi:hypothetical protein
MYLKLRMNLMKHLKQMSHSDLMRQKTQQNH